MSDVKDTINAIVKVIEHSKEEVFMVSDDLTHEVYQSQRVCDAIQMALDKNVIFDIIVGPNYDPKSTFVINRLGGSVYIASTLPERNFAVGDSKHIRYERRYDPIDKSPEEKEMSALNNYDVAAFLVERFKELKPECIPMRHQEILPALI